VCCLILAIARAKAPYPLLLADRFAAGTGWIEILLLALYAAWLARRMLRAADTARLRLAIWLVFSVVFFSQLILGALGIERLLMTGRLHVPVPAVVIAGPLYRGERFFMPILFAATLLLVGPAWCSHLCYVGAWDGVAATRRGRPAVLSARWGTLRLVVLAATPGVAIALRVFGVGGRTAALVAVGFGLFGALVMALVSTRKGRMVHCTAVCPLGLLGNVLGKISPFRLRIGAACTECGRCIPSCRYGALTPGCIHRRRPGLTCSLCGDCLSACPERALSYGFVGLSPLAARSAFVALVVALHAVFLGVARI
jgi:polyferredoxin